MLVKSGKLNANGVLKVRVNDTNGNNITAYKAVVSPTSDTKRGVTQRRNWLSLSDLVARQRAGPGSGHDD